MRLIRGGAGSRDIRGWRFPETVDEMEEAKNRMPPQHSGAGIAHDRLGLFTPLGPVAVDGAVGTGRLVFPKSTTFQAHGGIIHQSLTVRAEVVAVTMLVRAIDLRHGDKGPVLTSQPTIGQRNSIGIRWRWSGERFRYHVFSMPQTENQTLISVKVWLGLCMSITSNKFEYRRNFALQLVIKYLIGPNG
jgi:hypothetical protein